MAAADSDSPHFSKIDQIDDDFKKNFSLCIGPDKNIYFLNIESYGDTQVFKLKNKFKYFVDLSSPDHDQILIKPSCLCFGPNQDLYIFDLYSNCIFVFDKNYTLKFKIGSQLSKYIQFDRVFGMCFDPTQKYLYVADSYNHRIQVFNRKGQFKFHFGSYGSKYAQFNYPEAICFGPNGLLYVSDTYNNRIQVFDQDGMFKFTFGSYGSEKGQFKFPHDLCFSQDNLLCICDTQNNRIQVFNQNGEFQFQFGLEKEKENNLFHHPMSIVFDQNDLSLYIGDSKHGIQVFKYFKS